MIEVSYSGDWSKTFMFLQNAKRIFTKNNIFDKYGQRGVEALAAATPKDTGITANSWGYKIEHAEGQTVITWTNSNVHNHVNVAIILQYGHGTGTGGYVQGRDYINPALRSIFDQMADELWKEVTSK